MSYTSSETVFLGRIRNALGGRRGRPELPVASESIDARDGNLAARFATALEAVGGRFAKIESRTMLQQYVHELISSRGIRSAAISNASIVENLRIADWLEQEVETVVRPTENGSTSFREFARNVSQVDLGVTGCQVAVADTGTVILTNAERNRLISLLPAIHVVVFTPSQLVGGMGEALRRARADIDLSIMTLITGPSRTGDIEMTLTAGVHGPREIHALLIEDLV